MRAGIELELFVRNEASFAPDAAATSKIVSNVRRQLGSTYLVGDEALTSLLEVRTHPTCELDALVTDLHRSVLAVVQEAERHSARILPMSLEPLHALVDVNRSNSAIERIAARKHGTATFRLYGIAGTHLNISFPETDALMHVYNSLQRCVHLFIALTANSPFFAGRNSGVLAMRQNIRSLFLDSGGVAGEEATHSDLESYLSRNAQLTQLDELMRDEFAHNLPIRIIRRGGELCLEIQFLEVIPTLGMLAAITDVVCTLVQRLIEDYRNGIAMPESFFAPVDLLSRMKCGQSAVKHGRNGLCLNGRMQVSTIAEAISRMMHYVTDGSSQIRPETWDAIIGTLNDGTPAERAINRCMELHVCSNPSWGCDNCQTAIVETCKSMSAQFHSHVCGWPERTLG